MRKAAIALIIIGIVVVIGANLFIGTQPEPELAPVRDETTLRRTLTGEVVGFRDGGARSWQGLPFAAAPVDDLRWRAPQPPTARTEVLEALAPGNVCPQFASLASSAGANVLPGAVTGNEDCLYLNIWSPPNAAGLPVMFWIHGGGNTLGDGGSYNGANLATRRDVVVVTINYRLGIFGWFSHPALDSGNPLHDSGNYGTLDAIRALEWVQDNIAEFGGDPGNVTVFGESAGARDTLAMMASPLAKGLFHRAIVQSGGYQHVPMTAARNFREDGGHANSSVELMNKFLIADGSVPDREAARRFQEDMNPQNIREYLYAKPAEEFFVHLDGGGFGMYASPRVLADGHVLPDMPVAEIFGNTANHNAVPVILGTNRDEPALFMTRDPRYVTNFLGLFPRLKDEQAYLNRVKYGALAWKERGVDSLAELMTSAGNADVYAYRFDWDEEPSQFGFDLSKALGAAHAIEIAFVFEDFDTGLGLGYLYPGDEPQMALASSMSSYWSEFAYRGNPASGRSGTEVEWLAWGTDGKHSIILDSPTDQGIYMDAGIVTKSAIKAELAADQNFDDPALKCELYALNFRDDDFSDMEYQALTPACANLDPSGFGGF